MKKFKKFFTVLLFSLLATVLLYLIFVGTTFLGNNQKNPLKAEGDYWTLAVRGESSLILGNDLVLKEKIEDQIKPILENALNATYLENGRILACNQSMALLELRDGKWEELLPICSVNGPFFQIPGTNKIIFMKPYGCKGAGDYASFNSIAIYDFESKREEEILKIENRAIDLYGIFKNYAVINTFENTTDEKMSITLLPLFENQEKMEKIKELPLFSHYPQLSFTKPYLSYPVYSEKNEKKIIIINLEKEKKIIIDGEEPKWRKEGLEIIKNGKKTSLTLEEIESLINKEGD